MVLFKKSKRKEALCITLDPEVVEALNQVSRVKGISKSTIINTILRKTLLNKNPEEITL